MTPWTWHLPVANPLPTQNTTQHRINAHEHSCLEWDSNQRSQCSIGRPLWSSNFSLTCSFVEICYTVLVLKLKYIRMLLYLRRPHKNTFSREHWSLSFLALLLPCGVYCFCVLFSPTNIGVLLLSLLLFMCPSPSVVVCFPGNATSN
jgi:hypothetical protein